MADPVSIVLAYLLVGAVIWMLMFSAGLIKEARGNATTTAVTLASVGAIVAWPVIVAAFFAGALKGWRARR